MYERVLDSSGAYRQKASRVNMLHSDVVESIKQWIPSPSQQSLILYLPSHLEWMLAG